MAAVLSNKDIYQILESEIVTLKIRPGESLTENGLCERFHVSRTPIRGVLQRLQENRFVDIVPHKSTTVTAINLDIATQRIYERVAVESMVFRDFIRSCTPTDVERVRFFLQEMEQFTADLADVNQLDINYVLTLDHQMHNVWFTATGKHFLWERITRPDPDYSRLMHLDIVGAKNFADVHAEHKEMMALIDARKTDTIEELMSRHLYGGVRRIGSQLFSEEYRGFFQKT